MGKIANGSQLEKFGLNFSSWFCTPSKKIDINGRGFFSLPELKLYRPLDVQTLYCAWVELPINNFRIVWTKNPRNLRVDVAPFKFHKHLAKITFDNFFHCQDIPGSGCLKDD